MSAAEVTMRPVRPRPPTTAAEVEPVASYSSRILARMNTSGPRWAAVGVWETEEWRDTIYLAGFWEPGSCSTTRQCKSSLIVPGDLLVTERMCGDALNVLNTVVSYWPT